MEQASSRILNKQNLMVFKFIHWQSHITGRNWSVFQKESRIPWIGMLSCKMYHEHNCCYSWRLCIRWWRPEGIDLSFLKNVFFPQFFFLETQTYSQFLVAGDPSKDGQQPHLLRRIRICFRKLCKKSMNKNYQGKAQYTVKLIKCVCVVCMTTIILWQFPFKKHVIRENRGTWSIRRKKLLLCRRREICIGLSY